MKNITRKVLLRASKFLPRSEWGDRVSALVIFFVHQGRLPKKKGGSVNDVIFRIKTSSEILNPIRQFVSDKELLKLYVTAKVGSKYNVPTLATLKTSEEVDEYVFPESCAVKATHASGCSYIRAKGKSVDATLIKSWLKVNYYDWTRERNYRYLTPKIIVEPLVFNDEAAYDYKIFCFGGVAKFIKVDCDRHTSHQVAIYSRSWERLPVSYGTSKVNPLDGEIEAPECLNEMIWVAEKLSENLEFIRVDLYTNGEQIYIGEMTNIPGDTRAVFGSNEQEQLIERLIEGCELK